VHGGIVASDNRRVYLAAKSKHAPVGYRSPYSRLSQAARLDFDFTVERSLRWALCIAGVSTRKDADRSHGEAMVARRGAYNVVTQLSGGDVSAY